MKKGQIISLIGIFVAIVIIVYTSSDSSYYVTFDQAVQMSMVGSSPKVHVVGELKRNENNEIIGIEKSPDYMSFSFLLVDENIREQRVHYDSPMPTDFMRSEKIVVIGAFHQGRFIADKILLKCPSKYTDKKLNAGI